MGSKKRSAWAKQKADFEAQLGGYDAQGARGVDEAFAREDARQARAAAEKEAALRWKACERKNRYATRGEAEAAIASCAEWGTTGLHCYKCPHCGGWHLTSKPE